MLWTLQDKKERRPASCMLYLATVGYDLYTKTAQVEAFHSLRQSRLPPHAVGPIYIAMISSCQDYAEPSEEMLEGNACLVVKVVVSANHDSVAIAIDPADPRTAAETIAGLGTGVPLRP